MSTRDKINIVILGAILVSPAIMKILELPPGVATFVWVIIMLTGGFFMHFTKERQSKYEDILDDNFDALSESTYDRDLDNTTRDK